MWLCDYTNDLGFYYKRYKPYIAGIDTFNNRSIPTHDVLLQLSNYVDTGGYYEVGDREGTCSTRGRKRRLILQKRNIIYELEYYLPFRDLDWSVFTDETLAVETIPEFINDGDLQIMLRDWT
jgi:hypothetical protein